MLHYLRRRPKADEIVYSAESQQAAIEKAVADAIAANNTKRDEQEQGLKQNRDSLLAQGRELKDKLQANEDELTNQRLNETNVAEIRSEIETKLRGEYDTQLSDQKIALDNLQKTMDNKTINSALDAHLNDLKVKSTLRNALKAVILAENKISLTDGNVMIGDQDASSYMTAWSKSDKSKDFILAEPSTGGGSNGSNTSAVETVDFSSLSGTDAFMHACEAKK